MSSEQSKPTETSPTTSDASPAPTLESALEQAKRACALKNYDQAVEHYAIALELMTKKHGDASPECADLYFAYGMALLENAIAQNSVLGKEETAAALSKEEDENHASGSGVGASDTRIHFGEDEVVTPEDEDNEVLEALGNGGEEQTVDLFAEATKMEPEGEGEPTDEGGIGEPEDDFNAAWDVLEVARSLYEAQKDSNDQVKLKLADTYIALGDVSLETEKLEQAVDDYKAAVALKSDLLPLSSRQIAEVHYKLCIVYDMTAGRLAHAIEHATKAEASVQARLDELAARLKTLMVKNEKQPEANVDVKGKGQAISTGGLEEMTKTQLESEIKELQGLLEEVSLKIEELKSSPNLVGTSAPDLVAQELDRELNGGNATSAASKPVNDLTSRVVKKKKAPEPTGEKRKADEEVVTPPGKKARIDGDDL